MESQRPTKKQRELLSFIDGFIKGHGYGPSYREVMRALNYSSVSTVAIHINNLINRGHLRKRDRSARSLEVVSTKEPITLPADNITTDQAKWLVDIINNRFDALKTPYAAKEMDDLYVLVGALHVLGLNEAHVAARSKLMSLEKTT